jgi:hypothetical protein
MGIGDVATAPIDLTDDQPGPAAPRGRKRKADLAGPAAQSGQAQVKRVSRTREYAHVEVVDLTNVKSVRDERLVKMVARNSNKAIVPVPDLPVAAKKARVVEKQAGKIESLANPDAEKRPRRWVLTYFEYT